MGGLRSELKMQIGDLRRFADRLDNWDFFTLFDFQLRKVSHAKTRWIVLCFDCSDVDAERSWVERASRRYDGGLGRREYQCFKQDVRNRNDKQQLRIDFQYVGRRNRAKQN